MKARKRKPGAVNANRIDAPEISPEDVADTRAFTQTLISDAIVTIVGAVDYARYQGFLPRPNEKEPFPKVTAIFCKLLEDIEVPGRVADHFLTYPVPEGATFTDGVPIRRIVRLPVSRDLIGSVCGKGILPLAIRHKDILALMVDEVMGLPEIDEMEPQTLIEAVQKIDGISVNDPDIEFARLLEGTDIYLWAMRLWTESPPYEEIAIQQTLTPPWQE